MYIQVIGRMLALPNGARTPRLGVFQLRVAWQERRQVRLTPIGPTPGPPPPCGMQKVLCRFRCETSPPNLPGAQADHGVHVGAVDVHLAAVVVDDRADFADAFLEHAVGRRVGDHQRGQAFAVLDGLGAQVVDVDVAAGVAGGHHHRMPAMCGGRVGAVGRRRDQADVAVASPRLRW
jgi:hypothetical protein